MEQNATKPTFFRRKLPPTCIDYASPEGKERLIRCLTTDNANIYMKLSSQFRTQDEPAFCGLSTLVMVLNALDVDPGRAWKAPFRFYHESLLDCCLPLSYIKQHGITMQQFECLAACNRLLVEAFYANESEEYLAKFRENTHRSVASEDTVIVVNYDRQQVSQTGKGHFSPIAAYDTETDSVLLLDVARFKYPPHWLSIELLRDAMLSKDSETGCPRGYLMMKLNTKIRERNLFQLKANIEARHTEFQNRVKEYEKFLGEPRMSDDNDEVNTVVQVFKRLFSDYACCSKQEEQCCDDEDSECQKELRLCCNAISEQVESTAVASIADSPSTAALFLAWPMERNSERSDWLKDYVKKVLSEFSSEALNDIQSMRSQIKAIICCSGQILL